MQLAHLPARALMTREITCVDTHQSLAHAAELMARRRVRHLPVIERDALVGLLTQRDLLASQRSPLDPDGDPATGDLELHAPISRAMTRRVYAVDPESSVLEVVRAMTEMRIGCAPIVDSRRRLLGLVTETDFLRLAARLLGRRPPLAVRELMTRTILTATPAQRLARVEADMILGALRHVPVVDPCGHVIGLISHRDVLRWRSSVLEAGDSFPHDPLVGDIMTRPVLTIGPGTPTSEAAGMLLRHRIGCLPVVEQGRVIGIVTVTNILELLVSELASDEVRMTWRDAPVHYYMSAPIRTIAPDASVALADELLRGYRVASLVVVEDDRPLGVVTRTDLLGELVDDPDAPLPVRGGDATIASRMTRNAIAVEASSPLVAACARMLDSEVHQVVAMEDGVAVGVLSRSDAVAAVRDLGLEDPLIQAATPISFTMSADQSIQDAQRFVNQAELSTVLVTDGRHPIGVFGPRERLHARDLPPDTPVGWACNPGILVLPADLPLNRAAAQFAATGAALVVVLRDGLQAGVLTATDFCRALARLA
jgi:CBS domain-containing membrane protein